MVRRSIEIVAGEWASLTGLALLAYFFSLSFTSDGWSPFGHAPDLTGMGALAGYTATLAFIAVGALLHGVPSIIGASGATRAASAWAGRLALWLGAAGLLVLIVLSLPSIGLLFI
ncbi:MAG: hypothetical protein KGO05_17040, partial [Chloroflexota bacterium]|nr:hypothetical protein [Chloroflexota bacterium]